MWCFTHIYTKSVKTSLHLHISHLHKECEDLSDPSDSNSMVDTPHQTNVLPKNNDGGDFPSLRHRSVSPSLFSLFLPLEPDFGEIIPVIR